MPDPEQDNRRFPRMPSANVALVKSLSAEGSEDFAKTRSMGLGGCGLHSREPLGVGTPLELLISVEQRVVSVRGRVVYEHPEADGWEAGVEFLDLDPDAREAIGRLLGG